MGNDIFDELGTIKSYLLYEWIDLTYKCDTVGYNIKHFSHPHILSPKSIIFIVCVVLLLCSW